MIDIMKTLLVVLFCFCTPHLIWAEMDVGAILEDMETCRNSTNMSEDEFSAIMAKQMPESTEGKCFIFCMFRSMAVVNEEGELNVEGCRAMLAEAPVDDDQKDKMKDIPDECLKDVKPVKNDGCENAYQIALCMKNKAEEKGIEAPM